MLIKKEDQGPTLYCANRVGYKAKAFTLYKFRTMVLNADKLGASSTADDDLRITSIGRILRKYKLDELPQLFNVLNGTMSFVGPRPQIQWAVEQYTPEEYEVLLSVKPGITDYASVQFCNEGEILKGSTDPDKDYMEKIHPEKIRLAMLYVDTANFWTDITILCRTVLHILKRT